MAGDWIKVENVTPDKPEIHRMAELLVIEPEHVLGALIRVWIWADEQTEKGNAPSVTQMTLNRVSRVKDFAAAMRQVGWLTVRGDIVEFPNFDRHNGQTAKQRALTAKRVSECKKRKGNAASVTSALPREEKRESIEPGAPPTPSRPLFEESAPPAKSPPASGTPAVAIPAALAVEPFVAAWEEWLAYRRERRLSSRDRTLRAQLESLAPLGPVSAAECLRQSIRNGWQGIFPERSSNGRTGGGPEPVRRAQRYRGP